MLEQLYSLESSLDALLTYVYPQVDITPVLLTSHPGDRAQQKATLSGMSQSFLYSAPILTALNFNSIGGGVGRNTRVNTPYPSSLKTP